MNPQSAINKLTCPRCHAPRGRACKLGRGIAHHARVELAELVSERTSHRIRETLRDLRLSGRLPRCRRLFVPERFEPEGSVFTRLTAGMLRKGNKAA